MFRVAWICCGNQKRSRWKWDRARHRNTSGSPACMMLNVRGIIVGGGRQVAIFIDHGWRRKERDCQHPLANAGRSILSLWIGEIITATWHRAETRQQRRSNFRPRKVIIQMSRCGPGRECLLSHFQFGAVPYCDCFALKFMHCFRSGKICNATFAYHFLRRNLCWQRPL